MWDLKGAVADGHKEHKDHKGGAPSPGVNRATPARTVLAVTDVARDSSDPAAAWARLCVDHGAGAGAVVSLPFQANQSVPMTPNAKATRRFVSGEIHQSRAPPKAANATRMSRTR